MMLRLFVVVVVLTLVLGPADAEVFTYNKEKLSVIQWRRAAMYAPEDITHRPPGNGESFIKLDVTFTREASERGVMEILIIRDDIMKDVGVMERDEDGTMAKQFCCTRRLREQSSCAETGKIIAPEPSDVLHRRALWFEKDQKEVDLRSDPLEVKINKTGLYYVLFSLCNQVETGDVWMTGQVSWMNPYGHLRGDLYPMLPFYGRMAVAYVVVAAIWFTMCFIHWSELLQLQNFISVVILMGMVEMATWYFDLLNFNNTGVRHVVPIVIGVLLSTLKKTVSRVLVLIVSMGYGTVRPSLGSNGKRVLALGIVYAIFSAILEITTTIGHTNDVAAGVRLLVIMPVAMIDGAFYWWIFYSLYQILEQLSLRKQTAKLSMYRRFTRVLIASIVISSLWVAYQIFFISTNVEEQWESKWMFDAFWHVLYFGILVCIMIIWAPSKNAKRYAYSEEIQMELEEEEESGGVPLRQKAEDDFTPSFTLDEEDDEGEEEPMMEKTN